MVLDRELTETVVLKVSARDGGTTPKYANTTVSITVLDVNDMAPSFGKESVEVSVSEHAELGTKIASLVAVDQDKGPNGTVVYSIMDDDRTFKIDPKSGDLTVNSNIDREEHRQFDLKVIAADLGQPPLTSTVSVTVNIGDINDNDPVFYPEKYFVVLQPDFDVLDLVVQLRATDADEGVNAALSYELVEGSSAVFRVERETGKLFLNKPVQELPETRFSLVISAKDGKGRKSATLAEVEILVDSPAVQYLACTEDLYSFEVTEDSSLTSAQLGRQVGAVSIANPGLLDLEYIITDGNEKEVFTVSSTTGVIITGKAVDREEKDKYLLKINVISASQSISAVCIAEIKVLDVNDNEPSIQNSNRLQIYEDAPINEIIATVSVKDLDEGQSALHEFRITNPSEYFEINSATGAITLTRPLKQSPEKQIKLAVEVNDLGKPQLKSDFEFIVDILDINDHTPYFDQDSYELSVPEDILVNSKLYLLKATDADTGENGRIDYKILSGDNNTFGIFPDGNIYLKMALDREKNDYYSLTVGANDNGSPERSSTLTLTIHVSDINDNSPHFTSSHYAFSLRENEGENTYIGKIHAQDADIGRNAELSYSLEENQKYFEVEAKTGFILTKTSLDREKLITELGTDSISFEVVVTDNGLPKQRDSASVTVQVFDENDNTPTFTSDNYVARVSESLEPGSEVKGVYAVDEDLDENGRITYSIIAGDKAGQFKINSTTGVIYLRQPLDRETTSTYSLSVLAKDNGSPSRSSSSSVKISVLDENDNKPRITNTDLMLTLPEDTNVGQEVFQFFAEDNDLGENAEIRFFIGEGSYQKSFRIDPFSGILYLQKSLDFEKDQSFTLKISATDQGSPKLSDSVTLKVKVTDVNDNPPRFPSTAIVRQVQEGIGLNTPILTIEAQDDDSGSNGKIEYSLAGYEAGSSEKFAIDPLTGIIRTVGNIDREEIDTYRFTVVAADMAVPATARLSSEKIITIIIEDINDNTPEFESVPVGIVNLGTQIGDKILSVRASDRDTNSNGLVTYELQQKSFLFKIDHYSGDISLQNRFERLEPVYQLVVVAADEAVQSERRSSSTTVTILGVEAEEPGVGFQQVMRGLLR